MVSLPSDVAIWIMYAQQVKDDPRTDSVGTTMFGMAVCELANFTHAVAPNCSIAKVCLVLMPTLVRPRGFPS